MSSHTRICPEAQAANYSIPPDSGIGLQHLLTFEATMRVLMLHSRYLLQGGEERTTESEMALLSDHGHHAELLERDNREIERLGRTRTALGTIWSSDSYRRILQKLRTERFDVMHVQNFFPLWSPSVYYAAARCGVPVVQTLHNYRLMCVDGLLSRDQKVCEVCLGKTVPWRGVVHGCYRNSRAGSAVVAGMIGGHKLIGTWHRKVQAYIALSEYARAKYVAGGLPAERISLRPTYLHPAPAAGTGGGGYALYVGRLSPEKGIATLLEAWKGADHVLPLKIVGDGPLRDVVAAACQASSRIEYLGARSLEDVLELMSRAEWLVFPSEWNEPLGRTLMEAFAVGTPVVATGLGAPGAMVVPGQTGFHFTAGDARSLREQVEWCSRHVPDVRALRTNVRATFEARYAGSAAVTSLLSIYRAAQALLCIPGIPD